jgi:hypothetical protein
MIDCLLTVLRPAQEYFIWRAAKFRPMLGAQGLGPGRDLYRATPAVTRSLGFFGLIFWRSAPFEKDKESYLHRLNSILYFYVNYILSFMIINKYCLNKILVHSWSGIRSQLSVAKETVTRHTVRTHLQGVVSLILVNIWVTQNYFMSF